MANLKLIVSRRPMKAGALHPDLGLRDPQPRRKRAERLETDLFKTPKGKKAPGLRKRHWKKGPVCFYWQAPKQLGGNFVRVHGTREEIAERCRELQAQALRQMRALHIPQAPRFTGTLGSLIRLYLTDRTSEFRKLRPGTQDNYRSMLNSIDATYGERRLGTLGRHDFFDWHQKWMGKKREHVSAAFSKTVMLKVLFKFGLGQFAHCDRLRLVLQGIKFEQPQGRGVWATREQVNAIRNAAHEAGEHDFAFVCASQFETALRQKDQIGEWLRNRDGLTNLPGKLTTRVARWDHGLLWEHIDNDLILSKPTSKSNFKKVAVHDLTVLPMVVAELQRAYPGCITVETTTDTKGNTPTKVVPHREKLPAHGPVFIEPKTGKPWRDYAFRRMWRSMARKAGVPDEIQNRDERSGAVTEASSKGADLEHIRQFAGHSEVTTTQGYNRDTLAKSRLVALARASETEPQS